MAACFGGSGERDGSVERSGRAAAARPRCRAAAARVSRQAAPRRTAAGRRRAGWRARQARTRRRRQEPRVPVARLRQGVPQPMGSGTARAEPHGGARGRRLRGRRGLLRGATAERATARRRAGEATHPSPLPYPLRVVGTHYLLTTHYLLPTITTAAAREDAREARGAEPAAAAGGRGAARGARAAGRTERRNRSAAAADAPVLGTARRRTTAFRVPRRRGGGIGLAGPRRGQRRRARRRRRRGHAEILGGSLDAWRARSSRGISCRLTGRLTPWTSTGGPHHACIIWWRLAYSNRSLQLYGLSQG